MVSEATRRYLEGLDMSKRARAALDVMLQEGAVTTRTLSEVYKLDHPPRAIRDLKDAGALVGSRRVSDGGRTISEYFLEDMMGETGAPRNPTKKTDKERIIAEFENHCAVCGIVSSRLQLDHRVPFAIAGDPANWSSDTGMPLCSSDNRAKSWACEHCVNWTVKDPAMCAGCMWCRPEDYDHIAGIPQRRLVVTATTEADVELVKAVEDRAERDGLTPSETVLRALRD